MHLPEIKVANFELEAMKELETTDEWIRQRTGIECRYYAAENEAGNKPGPDWPYIFKKLFLKRKEDKRAQEPKSVLISRRDLRMELSKEVGASAGWAWRTRAAMRFLAPEMVNFSS